jgi:hypothetical protein
MPTLLSALVAFLKEHQHCGDLDGAVEGGSDLDDLYVRCENRTGRRP